MEELLELRQLLEQGKIHEALLLVDELEEMSLGDKINKIDSYGVILLIHLTFRGSPHLLCVPLRGSKLRAACRRQTLTRTRYS
ncbi:hypothetical protein KBT16_19155 [Nostoc sp. CCCryo 231-06]|nr:hypothetical protein [Nostoc sp. CCCryo 231-06]